MLRVLENGASGVFLKHSPPSRLVEAIRKVFAGEVWLDPAVTRSIIAAATGNTAAPRRTAGLTQREQAVLKGVFEGLTNKEIGARLTISESSVKAVLQQLFEKTGVRTRQPAGAHCFGETFGRMADQSHLRRKIPGMPVKKTHQGRKKL